MVVPTSRHPVAVVATTGPLADRSTSLTMGGMPQPAHSLWPPLKSSSLPESSFSVAMILSSFQRVLRVIKIKAPLLLIYAAFLPTASALECDVLQQGANLAAPAYPRQ